MSLKRIGILTSGGDAPGMNAAIRSGVRTALYNRVEIVGILRGYAGLINEELVSMNHRSVSNIINRGGTILKTARCPEFLTQEGQQRALGVVKKNGIDGLILIGGDGTYRGGIALARTLGVPCMGVPATIDNDLNGTEATIGSDTAVNTAMEAIDKIRDTATSLERIYVVEVMGRESGYIAMNVAVGGGAEDVVVPEKKYSMKEMCHDIVKGNIRGKVSWIVIVAEGASKGDAIAKQITETTSLETRVVVLGHVQRGGTPTARDRILASDTASEAVNLLLKGETGKGVGVLCGRINVVDFETAVMPKELPTDRMYNLMRMLT